MEVLTEEQQKRVMEVIKIWVTHKQICSHNTAADSALLARLLSGKSLLPKAPPKVGGRSCHALYDGETVVLNTGPENLPQKPKRPDEYRRKSEYSLAVDGHPNYRWKDESQGLVEHANGDTFKVWLGEYESKTVLSGEKYLEERWQMKLAEEAPANEEDVAPDRPQMGILRPRIRPAATTPWTTRDAGDMGPAFLAVGPAPVDIAPAGRDQEDELLAAQMVAAMDEEVDVDMEDA